MKKPKAKSSSADGARGIVVKSDDGDVCFRLRSTRAGLFVQRDRRRNDNHARLMQSVVFSSIDGFARWCESDAVRFDYPLVFATMKREGGALLENYERTAGAERDHEEP